MNPSFQNSPERLRGDLVLVDAASGNIKRVMGLQYNPGTLTRSLQIQGVEARNTTQQVDS